MKNLIIDYKKLIYMWQYWSCMLQIILTAIESRQTYNIKNDRLLSSHFLCKYKNRSIKLHFYYYILHQTVLCSNQFTTPTPSSISFNDWFVTTVLLWVDIGHSHWACAMILLARFVYANLLEGHWKSKSRNLNTLKVVCRRSIQHHVRDMKR